MIRKLKYYFYIFKAEFWLGMVDFGMRDIESLTNKGKHVEAIFVAQDVKKWRTKFEIANQKAEELKRA